MKNVFSSKKFTPGRENPAKTDPEGKRRDEMRQVVIDTKSQRKPREENEQGLHLVLLFPAPHRNAESHLPAQ